MFLLGCSKDGRDEEEDECANFEDRIQLVVNPEGSGTIVLRELYRKYEETGDMMPTFMVYELTAVPLDGYIFKEWLVIPPAGDSYSYVETENPITHENMCRTSGDDTIIFTAFFMEIEQ